MKKISSKLEIFQNLSPIKPTLHSVAIMLPVAPNGCKFSALVVYVKHAHPVSEKTSGTVGPGPAGGGGGVDSGGLLALGE